MTVSFWNSKLTILPREAIQQIKDRGYTLRFEGKLGEKKQYTGRILAVGIAYSKEDKNIAVK